MSVKTTVSIFALSIACCVCLPKIIYAIEVSPDTTGTTGTGSFESVTNNVIRRDADTAVQETVHTELDARGNSINITNHYTTIANGLNIKTENGSYVPASTAIDLQQDGSAVAQHTQHRVEFRPDITDVNGPVSFTRGDLKLVSRPLCVSYYDTATGQSVLIAEFRSTAATLAQGDSKIVWPDCTTDFKCNLIVENQLSGMDQCLEILEQPPVPADFGLNNDSTRLELITEFLTPPQPLLKTQPKNNADDDLIVDFGAARMTVGKAFKIGDVTSSHVTKHWVKMDNRDCLIEQVKYSAIQNTLAALPAHPTALIKSKHANKRIASVKRMLPERKTAANNGSMKVQIASSRPKSTGLILDYALVTSTNDFVFEGGTTYLVTNVMTLTGTTIIDRRCYHQIQHQRS